MSDTTEPNAWDGLGMLIGLAGLIFTTIGAVGIAIVVVGHVARGVTRLGIPAMVSSFWAGLTFGWQGILLFGIGVTLLVMAAGICSRYGA